MKHCPRRRGFTLVEVTISVALIAVLTGAVAAVVANYATTSAARASDINDAQLTLAAEVAAVRSQLDAATSSGPPAFTTEGTFTDTDSDITISRDATTTTLTFDGSADWEWVSITYDVGAGQVTDQLFKTSGPTTVGNLVKVSNTQVRITFGSNVAFRADVKFNGNSTGITYFFSAI